MLNNPNEWHNIEEDDTEGNVNADIAQGQPVVNSQRKSPPAAIKIVLIAVFIVLAGLVIVKKSESEANKVADIVEPTTIASNVDAVSSENEPTSVINVDLSDTPQESVLNESPLVAEGAIEVNDDDALVIEANNITPTDKYNFDKEAIKKAANKDTVIVSVGNEGRANPFYPFLSGKSAEIKYPGYNNISFDIVEPPKSLLTPPSKAMNLINTKISGIMYDTQNPSAIINISGTDQLVRKNDKIGGFVVLDITRDKVVIKSGTNVFRASVGQVINNEQVHLNDVANLKHKFGGAYAEVDSTSINFNAN